MLGLNRLTAMGHLCRDVEIRHTQAGQAMANAVVAVNEVWRDKKTGEKKENKEYIRCVLMAAQAEYAAEYAKKGALVYVEGKMQTRKWQDKDGLDRWTTEVMVRNFQLLGPKPKLDNMPEQYRPKAQAERQMHEYSSEPHFDPSEVPF